MTATIYHNPACSTSRKVLGMLREHGNAVEVVEYLKTPLGREALVALIARMGVPVRDVLRKTGTPYEALGLDDTALSDDALIDAMVAHPILMNRPIVVTPKGARLGRPPESVLALL